MKNVMKPESAIKPKDKSHFHLSLADLLRECVVKKKRGLAAASTQTQHDRITMTYLIFDDLRSADKLNYPITTPKNLKPHHVIALVNYWVEKGLSAATVENRLSLVRLIAEWIGKRDIVKPLATYAPGLKRTYAAKVDRSPSANGHDAWEVFDRVYAKDKYVGMQILLAITFGARRRECVRFVPLVHDNGTSIKLVSGTKNGKERNVLVDTPEKRAALDAMKAFAFNAHKSAKAHLGNPNNTLKQNLRRYSYVMESLGYTKDDSGFTGHSFRQEYFINELIKRGITPTIRGGSGIIGSSPSAAILGSISTAPAEHPRHPEQEPQPRDAGSIASSDAMASENPIGSSESINGMSKLEKKYKQVLTDVAYLQVSLCAGHFRKGVMTAYSGPLRVPKKAES